MSLAKDRTANRLKRKGEKPRNDRPLIDHAKDETVRKAPVRPARKEVEPLNEAQRLYDAEMQSKILTFGIGPAGTGKTWFAAARAAEMYRDGLIQKIIITRPAVEAADESMGFLPGELDEKYEPYFRPVREALEEILGSGHLEYAIKAGAIEARPLSLLRGATLKNCWVIFDEAQNSTPNQMKLLLTRIGANCKVIVNGDVKQMDIKGKSGLEDALNRVTHLKTVGVVEFTRADIVRSGFCQQMVECYENEADTNKQIEYSDGLERMLKVVK